MYRNADPAPMNTMNKQLIKVINESSIISMRFLNVHASFKMASKQVKQFFSVRKWNEKQLNYIL